MSKGAFDAYLDSLYYDQKMMMGRDRLYAFVRSHRPDLVADGLSRRKVMAYLQAQEIHQMFAPVRHQPRIQSTVPSEPFAIVALDLIDMNHTAFGGYKWALTGVDLFSKRAYAVPLQSKCAADVVKGLGLLLYGNTVQFRLHKHGSEDMSKWTISKRDVKPATVIQPQMPRHPRAFRSDNGAEFKNALMTTSLRRHTAPMRQGPSRQIFRCQPVHRVMEASSDSTSSSSAR